MLILEKIAMIMTFAGIALLVLGFLLYILSECL